MVCGKGTTFTVSLPPLFCHTGCESDDDSEIFNFLHFRLTAQGGGEWPNSRPKYAHESFGNFRRFVMIAELYRPEVARR